MAEIFLNLALAAACVAAATLLTERALREILHRMAPLLPSDFCGPEGWLVDTTTRRGIFDRQAGL